MSNPLMPAVFVNGEKIPAAVIAAEAQNHPAPAGKPGLAWRAAARALAVRALLLQGARAANIAATPEVLDDEHSETDEDALIRVYLDTVLAPAEITEAEIKRAHAANPEAYRAPDLFEASHILLAAKPGDVLARQAARAKAGQILQALQRAPARFGQIARESSECASAGNGGQLGQLRAGDTVPEFEAALRDLEVGQIAPSPVETRYGVHVLRLDNFARGKALPFDVLRPRLCEALEKAAWASAARALVRRLLDAAEIKGLVP